MLGSQNWGSDVHRFADAALPALSLLPPPPRPRFLPPLRLWRAADSCRCLVIRECRSIAPQTRAQRRQDSPRPARDSAVSSVGPSAAGPASLSTSPLDRLHLWSLGTDRHGGFCDTWSGTLSGGADLSHSHRWDIASRPLLREAGRPRSHLCSFSHVLNPELGSGAGTRRVV